jgi:hypothetical protein
MMMMSDRNLLSLRISKRHFLVIHRQCLLSLQSIADAKYRNRRTKNHRRFSRRVALGAAVLRRNGEKYDHSLAYAIGKRIDEGAIQEIMTKMFYPPETKPIDTTEE